MLLSLSALFQSYFPTIPNAQDKLSFGKCELGGPPFSMMKTEPSFLAPTSQHQHKLREWVGIGSEQGDTPGPRAAGSWGAGREGVWW